jgi:hypothetical protein
MIELKTPGPSSGCSRPQKTERTTGTVGLLVRPEILGPLGGGQRKGVHAPPSEGILQWNQWKPDLQKEGGIVFTGTERMLVLEFSRKY